ncbi:MAG: type II toxin-antitoxin system prevent-host-death family antitoxin [Legionellales bacterium]|nr:type II toxin-antitoxin system prevent-host-death family antitoxin [Legionellales bacterium]
MFIEIGAFEAKAKLSHLLQQVKHGQCYTITVRGQAIANLIPTETSMHANIVKAVERMRSMPKIKGINHETVTSWISEGRR